LVKKTSGLIVEKSIKQERSYVFCDSFLTFFFVLNKAVSFDVKNGDMSLQNIEENYQKKFPQSETKTGVFKRGPFRVHQIVVNLGKIILMSLYLDSEKGPSIEASFIIPASSYQGQLKIAESVIGSIQPAGVK
jgi:hypothetical protein